MFKLLSGQYLSCVLVSPPSVCLFKKYFHYTLQYVRSAFISYMYSSVHLLLMQMSSNRNLMQLFNVMHPSCG